ncbi:spinster family MFS transporter [Phenylobacterium soli]|uniref:MFS transporter n=1 Tax=Phenylobacterium soli TaxID=2170551 RepID=A0A328AL70_9CAUL|nr:MFS transporter [Phenylobacterium soli]RAK54766.1 MFS transporter [Phenylobacterium soli]
MAAAAMTGETSRPGYRYLVVWILAVVYTLNFLDRQILSILAEPIRKDLNLTDTQLGMLGGIAFAAFYTFCGIPVGWLADRIKRIWIMSAACGLWSLFTMGCGAATNFVQLAIMRMGVGVGEAGGSPPSYSLISDYFPAKERGTGLAIYSLGVPMGSMLGSAIGGWIAANYGWRMAFYWVGAPGLLMALILFLVVREPKRGGLDPVADGQAAHEPPPPLLSAVGAYFANRTLVLVAVSSGLSAFVGYAGLAWNPPFLIRVKGMSLTEVAAYYSLVLGITGLIGTFLAGWLADRLGHMDRRWYAWIPAVAFTVTIPFWLLILWAPTWQLTLAFIAVPALLNNMYLAPALAVVQNAVPPARRTISGATLLFVLNLVGLGGGPVFVGRISDMAKPAYGDHSLAVGFAALVPMVLGTVLTHLAASASIARDKRLAAAV